MLRSDRLRREGVATIGHNFSAQIFGAVLAYPNPTALYLRALQTKGLTKAQVQPFKLLVLAYYGENGRAPAGTRRLLIMDSGTRCNVGMTSNLYRAEKLSQQRRTCVIGYSTRP